MSFVSVQVCLCLFPTLVVAHGPPLVCQAVPVLADGEGGGGGLDVLLHVTTPKTSEKERGEGGKGWGTGQGFAEILRYGQGVDFFVEREGLYGGPGFINGLLFSGAFCFFFFTYLCTHGWMYVWIFLGHRGFGVLVFFPIFFRGWGVFDTQTTRVSPPVPFPSPDKVQPPPVISDVLPEVHEPILDVLAYKILGVVHIRGRVENVT